MPIAVFGIIMFVATGLVYGIEAGYFPKSTNEAPPLALLVSNEKPLKLEIARTPYERKKGLSGRSSLPADTGLWFVFDKEGKHGIWMKDMHFAIDIVWLDSAFVVVDIKESATPESYPSVFTPRENAKYVLEVNAGKAKEMNLSIGKKAEYMEFVAGQE